MFNQPSGEQQVKARSNWVYDGIELYFRIINRSAGKRYAATRIEYAEVPEVVSSMDANNYASFVLQTPAAQALMDELWNCGIRPTEGTGSAGQSAAQQDHIKDLREVTNRLLGVVEHGQS